MKRGGGVHTVTNAGGSGWVNKLDGAIVSRHRSKKTAVARGRVLAIRKRTEHSVHRRDGCITQKNSYGNDPCPPRDGR